MNNFRKFFAIVIVAIMLLVINSNVKAANKLADEFPDSITAKLGRTFSQDGIYLGIDIYKKHYEKGKAFCATFFRSAPYTGTKCTPVAWNSNDDKNMRIGAGVANIVLEARKITNSAPGNAEIGWEQYFYGEMSINDFLYTYNGKNSDNNMARISNWSKVKTNSTFIKMKSLAEKGYDNYGNASIELNGAELTVSENGTTAVGTVNAICKSPEGNTIKCNIGNVASFNAAVLKEMYAEYNGQRYPLSVSSSESNDSKTVLTTGNIEIGQVDPNTRITFTYNVTANYNYPVAQKYNCGQSYQSLVPNYIISKPKSMNNTASASYITNDVKCKLKINKVDSTTSTPLNGAKFDLFEIDGSNKIKKGRFTVDGTVEINNLSKTSTYSLVEVQAPTGYELDSTPISITFDDTNCALLEKTVTNEKQTGNLTINKVDEDGNNVAGAKLKVYRIIKNSSSTSDEDIYEYEYVKFDGNDYFITTDTPRVVNDLIIGQTYYVVEEAVPEGTDYAFKKNIDSVKIAAGNNTVKLENVHSNFKISKQAIAGSEELPGAKLEIFYENGNSTGWSWESTDKPQEISGLADGSYVLVETTAPNGYEKAESINFTIENGKLKDDEDNILVMKDKEIVEVPDTFTTSNIITMIAGLLLVTGGSVALAYEYKKRKTA